MPYYKKMVSYPIRRRLRQREVCGLPGKGLALFKVSDICDGCGLCASSCPLDVILQSDNRFEIGIGCNHCGVCAGVCPKGAIINY